MGFIKQIGKKVFGKKAVATKLKFDAFGPLGLTHRKSFKAFRKKLGLTSENKWSRRLKRTINGGYASYYQPTSASSYIYQPRTISELMGGR